MGGTRPVRRDTGAVAPVGSAPARSHLAPAGATPGAPGQHTREEEHGHIAGRLPGRRQAHTRASIAGVLRRDQGAGSPRSATCGWPTGRRGHRSSTRPTSTGELADYAVDPYAAELERPRADQRHRRGAVHRRRLLRAADLGAAARGRRARASASSSAAPTSAGPGTGTATPASPATSSPTTTCRCSTRWATCPPATTPAAPEILEHCRAIARRYDLYELAVFQTTVTSTVWDEDEQMWHVAHRPRRPHAGPLRDLRQRHAVEAEAGPDRRHGDVQGPLVPHVALGLRLHRRRTSRTSPTRSSASSAPAPAPCRPSPTSATTAKELYVFQRTPSSIDIRDDWETDPEWAAKLQPGWQAQAPRARR